FTANLFPTRYRYSGIAVSKEFNAAAIGGTAPLIATALILAANGDVWLVAVYSALLSLITVVGIVVAGRGVGNSPVEDPEDPEDALAVYSKSAPAAVVNQ
ncbi:MAG: shikimate transporter, partial [Arthrobacter sp.]|nr:shikimate transporter [Arthrobacter sp.]